MNRVNGEVKYMYINITSMALTDMKIDLSFINLLYHSCDKFILHLRPVPKFRSCHEAIMVITRRVHCNPFGYYTYNVCILDLLYKQLIL